VARPKEPWKKERILDAALAAIEDKAAADTTVNDVAQRAGVSPGVVHYHFADLDNVFLEVIDRTMQEMLHDRLAAIQSLDSVHQQLATLIARGLPDEPTREVELMYEGIGMLRTHPEFQPLVRSYNEQQVSMYRSVLDAGTFSGQFTPAEETAVIARNLVALEDAYDLYRVVAISRDNKAARRNVRRYAEQALATELPDV